MTRSPAPTTKRSRRSASSPEGAGATSWASSSPRARTCSPRPTRPAGTRPARYAAAGSGLDGIPVAPHVLADVSQLGSGTRALAVYPQRWTAPRRPALRRAVGRRRPGQRRHRAALGARVRRRLASRSGPGSADPFGHKAVRASMGALFSVPVARVRDVARAARAARRARRRARACRCTELDADGELTLVVGAEREGLPARRRGRVRRRRPHPDRPRRLAERRDGGDRRPLRAHD